MMNKYTGFFIVLLFISVVIGGSTYGEEENAAYWVDASSDTRIDQLALLVDEEQLIRLKAEVPAGKTLKAYNIALTYDVAKVSIEEVVASPGSSFPPTNINHNTPGTIIINGFDVTGLTGPAVVSFIDVTMKGFAAGCFDFVITVNSFGASSSDQFKPTPDALTVCVTAPAADLSVRKEVDNTTPNVGDDVVFTIEVTNNGPNDATGVQVTDQLPAGLSYVSDDSGGAYDPDIGLWAIGDLANGATAALQITARVDQAGDMTNTATRTASSPTDPDEGNDSDDATVNGQHENEAYWADALSDSRIEQLDLLVDEKQVIRLKAEVPAGKTLKAYNIALTYDEPKVSVEEVGASPGSSFPPTNINHNTLGTIIINGFDVAGVEGPAVVSFIDVTMKGFAAGCFDFVITVNSFGASSSDQFKPTPDDLSVCVTAQSADISVDKTVDNLTPNVGDSVIFTITVTNNGPNDATEVQVTDQLPSGLSYVDDDSAGGYDLVTGVWDVGSLVKRSYAILDIRVSVDQPGEMTNTATRTASSQTDINPGNDTGSVSIHVNGPPIGGYIDDNVIPSVQISQSANGDGTITIDFKIKDPDVDLCALNTFQYSVDGGENWNAPANGDDSESLSSSWKDNNGDRYSSAVDFDNAQEHSFAFNTKHHDVTGLDGEDQADVQVRFTINDVTYNSLFPVTSEEFRVDNLEPTVAISYSEPDPYREADTVTVTATFTEANEIAGTPQITIDYAGDGDDVPATDMTEVNNKEWTYLMVVPSGNDGTATITITGSDAAGNSVGIHSGNTFTVDNTAPSSSAICPAYANVAPISIIWIASDTPSGVASTELWYKKDSGVTWANTGIEAQTGTNGTFDYTPSEGDGTYYFATRSTDNAGNIETEPSGNGDDSTIYDTVAPDPPVITTNSGNDYSTTDSSTTLEGTCALDTVAIYVNGSTNGVTYTAGTTSWTYTGTLQSGDNTFDISAEDEAGNFSELDSITIASLRPYTPIPISPMNGEVDVPLTPELQTDDFSHPGGTDYTHAMTGWQVSTDSDFSSLILDITSTSHLTSLSVPHSILDEETTYYWQVIFYDNDLVASDWSDAFSFTTVYIGNDLNSNGIPDEQEVDDIVDLDGDGTPDIYQSDIKDVRTVVGDGIIGVSFKDSYNVSSIEWLESIDPATITDTANRPENIPLGLITFKLTVNNPGDTAVLTVYLAGVTEETEDNLEAFLAIAKWYKYDSINGWQDYSAYAAFDGDRKVVTLQLTDGSNGDADGTANGIIVDPSGLGAGNQAPTAIFTADPTSGEEPLRVNFNATASYDFDGTIDSYDWDFGDGSIDYGETTNHEYTEGMYTSTLTVTDNDGATDTATTTIKVDEKCRMEIFGICCFIATAAYGSPMEPHVMVLREFRDRFLLSNTFGKSFMDFYYANSSPIADFITEHDSLRAFVRVIFLPFVGVSLLALNIGLIPTLVFMLMLLTLMSATTIVIFRKTWLRRHRKSKSQELEF